MTFFPLNMLVTKLGQWFRKYYYTECLKIIEEKQTDFNGFNAYYISHFNDSENKLHFDT